MKHDQNKGHEDDFAAMLEQSFSGMESFQSGQLVETRVLSIGKDCVFLELNGKSEGIIALEELLDKNGECTVKVGDPLKAFFLQSKNGELHFTAKIKADKAGSAMLEQAWRNRIPVEGRVEKEIKGGFEVRIGDSRAFCPYSQMGSKRSDNPADFVGKQLEFRIQEYKEGGRNILVSNRVLHEEAQQERIQALRAELREGATVKGTIASVQDYGAFVDLGGFQALLPASEISRSRVEDIRAVLKPGQEIEAKVLKIDWAQERVSLSMKGLLADPWDTVAERFPEDSTHNGRVVRITNFGAFVNLEPGIDGLLHISEIRADGKFSGSKDVTVKVGQTLAVQIVGIDRANRRISLRQAQSAEEAETSRKYMDGAASEGDTYNPFAALLKKKK